MNSCRKRKPTVNTKSIARKIRFILTRPHVAIIMGFLLLFAGICEISETVIEEFIGFEVQTAHALIVFGLSQIIVAFTHVVEGLEGIGIATAEQKIENEIR
jgi:uncharacterized membrane protein